MMRLRDATRNLYEISGNISGGSGGVGKNRTFREVSKTKNNHEKYWKNGIEICSGELIRKSLLHENLS